MADGAARFRQGSSGPALLRIRICGNSVSNTRLSRSAAGLSRPFSYQIHVNVSVLQPRACRNTRGLGSSAFARRYLRNHCCSLLLRLLRCFTSPGVAPRALWIHAGAAPCWAPGCPIRRPPDQRPRAPPRGLSRLAASFVACRRLGIQRAPVQPGRPKNLRAPRRTATPPAAPAAGGMRLPTPGGPGRPRDGGPDA